MDRGVEKLSAFWEIFWQARLFKIKEYCCKKTSICVREKTHFHEKQFAGQPAKNECSKN